MSKKCLLCSVEAEYTFPLESVVSVLTLFLFHLGGAERGKVTNCDHKYTLLTLEPRRRS
jgi:hypothetical protein